MTCANKTTSLVEYLRRKMVTLAEQSGNLLDEEVIVVSQRLDRYLVQVQRWTDRGQPDHGQPSREVRVGRLTRQDRLESWSERRWYYRRQRIKRASHKWMI
ncbi:aspartyl-phosphate phosphatase Spo0E family protein [Alicyclobacillus acidiphilus]|uniref:aspartyl-phosphate phosphatase Spo0E family protein n=1 Tax=Alicyclobacillus acidiphilus TaxID=182455 RepID=UPI000A686BC2|nr:aspartyl-phosphate phosphatase Spo0E family protein [Alicyclobacillus acidiphilus]